MRYEIFPTYAAALARVELLKLAGRCAYALTLRADCHEVRSWA